MNETILEDAHEKRKRRKTALPFGQRSYFLLALIGSVEEGHDLAAGAVVIRAERGVGGAVGHLAGDRPAHSVRVESVRGNVDEA